MAILDFIKQKQKGMPARSKEESEATPRQVQDETLRQAQGEPVKEKKKKGGKASDKPKHFEIKASKFAYKILKAPHITEKSTELTKIDQYIFRTFSYATKPEIKRSVEEIYGVHVEQVTKIKVPRKKRRRGRIIGWKSGYTKAIVKLRKGESIEVLPH